MSKLFFSWFYFRCKIIFTPNQNWAYWFKWVLHSFRKDLQKSHLCISFFTESPYYRMTQKKWWCELDGELVFDYSFSYSYWFVFDSLKAIVTAYFCSIPILPALVFNSPCFHSSITFFILLLFPILLLDFACF